jgi:hypothetical protein
MDKTRQPREVHDIFIDTPAGFWHLLGSQKNYPYIQIVMEMFLLSCIRGEIYRIFMLQLALIIVSVNFPRQGGRARVFLEERQAV